MAISLPLDRPSGPKNTTVTATGENDSPAFPHPTYTKLKDRWEKCRAFMGESEEIRAGREKYLVPIGRESTTSYEARLKLVAVTNFFKRAVIASVGMLLQKEPVIGDDMPQKLKDYAEDVDLGGKHISVYAQEITRDYITDGLAATLVDYPKLDDPNLDWSRASQAAVNARNNGGVLDADDEERLGMRPFFVKYERSDILKVVSAKIRGVTAKVLVVLRETSEVIEGRFGIKQVVRYRVFRLTPAGVTWELWEGNEGGTDTTQVKPPTILKIRGQPARRIPFSLFGEFDELPPLENLADLNIEHHNLRTNRRNIETLAMVPTRVRIGAVPVDGEYPELVYGLEHTIEVPTGIQGVPKPVYWDSPDVTVLDPSAKSIEDLKDDIGTAALNFLSPDKRAAETARAKEIDNAAQEASISLTGRKLQDHLEECHGFAGEMIGEKAGSITIDTEFEQSPLSAEEMKQYLDAYLAGGISRETFLEAWKTGKRLDASLDVEEEKRRILKDNAPATTTETTQADGVTE